MPEPNERVYCLPANALPSPQEDMLPLNRELYHAITKNGDYLPRATVETDERYRQIIPYAVIVQGEQVFLVKRLRAGSEARLHDLYSVGIGGHINPADHANARDVIEGALARELREELHIGAFAAEAVGLIHSSEGAVSRVHTGVLYKIKTPGEVHVREQHKLRGTFATIAQLQTHFEQLESWSQIALRYLFPGLEPKK